MLRNHSKHVEFQFVSKVLPYIGGFRISSDYFKVNDSVEKMAGAFPFPELPSYWVINQRWGVECNLSGNTCKANEQLGVNWLS